MRKLIRLLLAAAMLFPVTTHAVVLVIVDLSVTNQITLTATSGASAVTLTGSDGTGIYLDDFFGSSGFSMSDTLVSGDFVAANNTSDGSPNLFKSSSDSGTGINVYAMASDDPLSFTAGSTAFSGMATWNVSAANYVEALAGAGGGLVYFPADDIGDLSSASVLGEWSTTVAAPEPATFGLLAAAGIVTVFRRRRRG
jgi:hypothetical protein